MVNKKEHKGALGVSKSGNVDLSSVLAAEKKKKVSEGKGRKRRGQLSARKERAMKRAKCSSRRRETRRTLLETEWVCP